MNQTVQVRELIVSMDHKHRGAGPTKNRALKHVTTEWVTFLDDDDELLPNHVEDLRKAQLSSGADVIYPIMHVPGRGDLTGRGGLPFDADVLRAGNYIATTTLVRTELLKKAGGFQGTPHDDWGAWLAMLDLGATFYHLPKRTFLYHFHGGNTGGQA